ncbi:hypothetical protein MFIFM68171_09704 [Madurella fahalii]|uniref:Tc1-like transposase DDE domain-containing protein n=1 Tax=Madurella fahalii TaxID=1157608 RepID=A0ABQ0GP46_9PEZI
MAPRLAPSHSEQIHAMILRELPNDVIANTVECSERAVRRIRSRLQRFGTTTSPPNRVGRESKITPLMRDAMFEQLARRPDMFRYEMIDFLHDSFGLEVSPTAISRTLRTERWTRKTNGRVAKQRNPDLRELYLYKLSDCQSYQLVFIDESGCDKRSGHRRQGWAPSGATPVQVDEFNREQRFRFLLHFIEQLLLHCGKWPEPNSVLVMDNASIHRSERLEQMCVEAGVRLLKLAPYSPDMNPIEEFFADIKAYIKQQRHNYADLFEKNFETFLRMSVDIVGSRAASAEGHFRHSGISIEYPSEYSSE